MAESAATEATAFWITGPAEGVLRTEAIRKPDSGEVLVEALASGISRGTETLVFRGRVPASQHQKMKAPFQEGGFDFPLKYGYSSVGRVIDGEAALLGRRVFCLHPHQDRYVVPADAVVPVPDAVPSGRAVLAANMETAVNALWDAPPRLGDRIAVIGSGVVGALVARLAADHPGVEVEIIDVNPEKARLARALDLPFARPDDALGDVDLIVHASGHPDGLRTALDLAAFEATILDLSWYGEREVSLPLGESFHSSRLKLISSQVGAIATVMRGRRSHEARLSLALRLLADERFDVLLSSPRPFAELPSIMEELANGSSDVMCQLVTYLQE